MMSFSPRTSGKENVEMSEAVALDNKGAAIDESVKIQEEEQPESQMDWSSIWKPMGIITGVFALFFWLPIDSGRFTGAVIESLALARWYAREHVLLCLVPAFFIAGAISVFVSQAAVMKYLGAGAASVCRNLEAWRGSGPGDSLSLFRPGHQRAGDRAHRPNSGPGDRPDQGSGGGGVQYRYRADHAPDVSQRGAGQSRCGHSLART
jgi:hypothetical protein